MSAELFDLYNPLSKYSIKNAEKNVLKKQKKCLNCMKLGTFFIEFFWFNTYSNLQFHVFIWHYFSIILYTHVGNNFLRSIFHLKIKHVFKQYLKKKFLWLKIRGHTIHKVVHYSNLFVKYLYKYNHCCQLTRLGAYNPFNDWLIGWQCIN